MLPTPADHRAASRAVLVLLAAFVLLLGLAPPALAHAAVRQTTPFDTERVETGEVPSAVTIEFNEPVVAAPGGIRVFDQDGERVDVDGDVPGTEADDVVGRALGELRDGGYIVTWRVVSADGHPLRGAFVFTVGDAPEVAASTVRELFGSDSGLAGSLVAGTAAVTYLVALFVLGALLSFGVLRIGADDPVRTLVRRAATVGVVTAVLAVPFQAMAVSGEGVGAIADGAQLTAVLGGSVGIAAAVRLAGFLGVLLLRGTGQTVAAGVAALSLLVDGHTRTVHPLALMLAGDALHVLAGAVWFGGLVVLVRQLRAHRLADDPVGGATMVAGWSRMATWSLIGVVVGGIAMSSRTVARLDALTGSTYGRFMILKLLLAGGVIALGAYNRFKLVPAVEGALVPVPAGGADSTTVPSDAGGTADDGIEAPSPVVTTEAAWDRLRGVVRLEVAGIVAVLLVTSLVVGQRPASEAVGIGGIFQVTEAVTDDLDLDIVIDPNIAGQNSIHLYLLDDTGRPFSGIEGLSMELSLPDRDIGPIEREPSVSGPGHWALVGRELQLPGRWEIAVTVRIDRFTEQTVTVFAIVGG